MDRKLRLWVICAGLIVAIGPLSIDMYLPSFPALQVYFAAMPGQVAEAVKDERLARLNDLIDAQARAFNAAQAGRTLDVLFEKPGRHPGQLIGRSPYLQAVHATAPDRLLGQIVPVRIEDAARNSLAGALALEPA